MPQISEFFSRLFSTSEWPPRWKCGYWSDFHGWMYILSDLLIWTSYFLIPAVILRYFLKKQNQIRFRKVYLLFAGFILLCGLTHMLDATMFWIPMYRVNALVRLATGIVSALTVYHLFRILPDLSGQRTNLELEQEILRRQRAERELEELNRGLQTFAYAASHDLQEPLRKMQLFTSLLQESSDRLDEGGRLYLDKLNHSARRMRTMIDDILTLSTLHQPEMKTVDTNETMAIALGDFELRIRESGASVKMSPLPAVRGNKAYLVQLFSNLIGNALKFSDRSPAIEITGRRCGDQVEIRISDNGIGIDPAHFQQIFQPFHRLHARSRYEGSGIGLAIVKRIVDMHRGDIRVESEVGRGTTFIVSLPAG